MTMDEIRQLRVEGSEPVATLEEMLDAARGRIGLFIELKGATADLRMADDICRMLQERDMTDSCVIISLDYALISAVETKYPELRTGYLCYYSFGNISDMNADMLLLEAETATEDNIDRIHDAGKQIYVWTANSLESLNDAVRCGADGVITDKPELAQAVINSPNAGSDAARILRSIFYW